jgi:alpha-tubulin suppressor-like RCC1 family protein
MKISFTKTIILSAFFLTASYTTNAQRIACGGWHSLAICTDSTVKAFGENATGQLGDGTSTDQSTPVTVNGLTGIVAVSAGGDQLEAHSVALKSNGTVWAWGSNLYGGLGNGTTTNSNAPVQALGLTNVIAIAAGGWHTVALKSDSTVWVWGWNEDGQLGDGTIVNKSTPQQVSGLSGVVAIAAGTYHVLALKADGTVWAWGDNVSGQIGNGNTGTDQTTPVQVSGLTNVVKITAGRFFSLAIKSDGTVWTWGENLYGQLGNGTTTDSNVPVQVSGLSGVTSAVAATGAFHCMAVKNDNTVWAWGRNTYGNLGDNTVANKSTPVQMLGISDVQGMAAGTNFSLVYKTDGTVWGCGRNASGQLGDGTTDQHNQLTLSSPVCAIVSGIKSIDGSDMIELSVFPNPSTGVYQINASTSIESVEVYNLLGEKIFGSSNNTTIDISNQPTGSYFLVLKANGNTYNQRLIKQ